ncbi:CHAP domain-containing protein [Macrococcus brunensis]|uniref:CHAP domain-containing protein n=1 Tax=Macrococcus brunensis TaxID=198483 RepID=A0A4R6BBD0_9STAP|nr:CHAP domain-containing protein [Macrococcus brunensis]TDL94275.1 CHAP domain-containing protein [Macrococcus brunensis]
MKKIFLFAVILLGAGGYHYRETFTASNNQLVKQMRPDPMTINTYDEGQCTYYVFDKVRQDGKMIAKSWNDAKYWATRAKEEGYIVNQRPLEGSLLQSARGRQGHVAYVEHVYQNGSIKVTEMNYIKPYYISERVLTKQDIQRYQFIHPKGNPRTDA